MIKTYVMFALATVIMMLPLTGNTMSYDRGYVEGVKHQQQVTLQTNTKSLSAFIGESEADLFSDEIAVGGVFGTSKPLDELAVASQPKNQTKPNCMASCHSNPEVGWRGSL